MKWINAKEKTPLKAGWYVVKLKSGSQLRVPLTSTLAGNLVWVLPDVLAVDFWLAENNVPHIGGDVVGNLSQGIHKDSCDCDKCVLGD